MRGIPMTLRSFFHFVELRTKVASMMPLLLGSLYSIWGYRRLDSLNLLLMFLSLICIDMATTASNHYTDFLKAVQRDGYNYERHNTLVRDGLSLKTALATIFTLVSIGVISGLWLALRTDLVVLGIGAVSFLVGLLYSWGPIPLSRTLFGEAASGFFMGFVIFFLSVYIHVFPLGWIKVSLSGPLLSLDMNIYEIFRIFMISSPLVCGIANIMLSNNLCDLDEDVVNGRQTLPIVIGKKWGLILSKGLYHLMFLSVLLSLFLQWVPISCGLVFLGIPFVYHASRTFSAVQSKAETFVLSVKSFLLVASMYCLGMGIGVLWL